MQFCAGIGQRFQHGYESRSTNMATMRDFEHVSHKFFFIQNAWLNGTFCTGIKWNKIKNTNSHVGIKMCATRKEFLVRNSVFDIALVFSLVFHFH